ncbi:hypothetical protein LCGC14_0993930 [marine sediment metagenome]|uniref:Uncharacterized protein n=1 Tax=marine sediment metagenome TaxID=412755 RepID=A0A0F9NRD3_9ZZZZ
MAKKFMVRKVFINKKTKQPIVTLSKKELRKIDPSIKFGEDLFVRLEILRRKKDGRKS